jgi:hypothetical protein
MNQNLINQIINEFKSKENYIGEDLPKFSDKNYQPIKISKDNFHSIKEITSNRNIAFIDGGNAELLRASNFSLHFIRLYAVIYKDNKRVKKKKKEFYCLVNSFEDKDEIHYKAKLFNKPDFIDENDLIFSSFDKTIVNGINRAEVSKIGSVVRRFSELGFAKEIIINLNKDDVIVLDGNLQSTVTNENKYLNNLYVKAEEKNVIVSAFCKTSTLLTEKGMPIPPLLSRLSNIDESWYYHPLVNINSSNHKAEMYFTKLNKSSSYVFRYELYKNNEYDINEILSLLKENSKDPMFRGYPYGLIEADRFARVSNNEKEQLKLRLMISLGKENKELMSYLNTTNAHDVLDGMWKG